MRSEFCTFDTELSTVNSQPGLCSWSVHAGSLEMQTHQECPPRWITRLECTLTNNGLECPVANSLDLKSPGITASWPFRGPEVLWRSSKAVTPLEYALTRHRQGPVNPLESALTRLLGLKSFRFCTYKKRGGGGRPAAMPLQSVFTFTVCFTSLSSGVHR